MYGEGNGLIPGLRTTPRRDTTVRSTGVYRLRGACGTASAAYGLKVKPQRVVTCSTTESRNPGQVVAAVRHRLAASQRSEFPGGRAGYAFYGLALVASSF